MWDNIAYGLSQIFVLNNLWIMAAGIIAGIIFGALPGFSATMGCAVCVPFSYVLEPQQALLLLSGVYCGGVYAGSIPAILVGIPGTPASAPTAFEGRALTRLGRGGEALGICTYASSMGGFLSSIALIFLAPALALIAIKVGPPEQAMIAVFGLSVVCMLSPDAVFKGLLVGFCSLLLACIGQDPQVGFPRFTFGSVDLYGGVSLVPILIGLFSFPEVISMLETKDGVFIKSANPGRIRFKPGVLIKNLFNQIRSTIIGIFIGIIPAAGPDIASFLSYNTAKRASKQPEKFGCGSEEGIIASETANNAVTGGSLIPLLALGIPGSAPAAIFLGAMYIHGLRPGAALFRDHSDTVYTLLAGFAVINILMFFIGLLFCKISSFILVIPKSVLSTAIVVLATVGAYAIGKNMFDVIQMYAAGICGYFMVKNNYPVSPVALALLLGALLESSLAQTGVMYRGNYLMMFTRPLTVVFACFVILSVFWPVIMKALKKLVNKVGKSA